MTETPYRVRGRLWRYGPRQGAVQVGPNIAGWMAQTGIQSNSWIADARVFTEAGLVRISELPGQLHAFLVLAAYIAVLDGAALWLFRRKE